MNKLTKTRQLILDEFIKCLEEDDIMWHKTWKVVNPMNALSRHTYQGINNLLLSYISQVRNYKDPRWITFNQVKTNGWKLNNAKGQGVPIEYWSLYDTEEKRILTQQEAKPILETEPERIRYIAKTYIVFNASLVEGISPFIEESKQIENEHIMEFFNSYLEAENITLEHAGNSACYIPSLDTIKMPLFEMFQSEMEYYDALAHEIAHSTGNEKRLNRDLSGCFGSENYAREELRAEISSAFLNAELGIPPSQKRMNNHKAYIQGWIKTLKEHPNELFKAIQDAETIKDYILEKGDLEFIVNSSIKEPEIETIDLGGL